MQMNWVTPPCLWVEFSFSGWSGPGNLILPLFWTIIEMVQVQLSHTIRRVHENIIIIGDPSEINIPDMPHREANMPHLRPIRDQQVSSETNWRPTCLIRDQHAGLETHGWPRVSDETCWSPMGLGWGMSVFDEACQSRIGLGWVSDRSPIIIIFLWTPIIIISHLSSRIFRFESRVIDSRANSR